MQKKFYLHSLELKLPNQVHISTTPMNSGLEFLDSVPNRSKINLPQVGSKGPFVGRAAYSKKAV